MSECELLARSADAVAAVKEARKKVDGYSVGARPGSDDG